MILLHVWPGRWTLPTIEPQCLAAIIYLQLTIPDNFTCVECTELDAAPYLTTPEGKTITTLPSIFNYVSSLRTSSALAGEVLTPAQKAQKLAWSEHMQANLGDLLACIMYARPSNWTMIHSTLAQFYPAPYSYYVPINVRDIHRPRLEAAGLWDASSEQKEQKKLNSRDKGKIKESSSKNFHEAFEREKVLEKARSILDIYTRLLDTNTYFLADRLTTVDVISAAYVLLLLHPPYPDPLLRDLLTGSYPALVSHAQNIRSNTLDSLHTIPISRAVASAAPEKPIVHKTYEELQAERVQWGWTVFAIGSLGILWSVTFGPLARSSLRT